MWDKKIDFDKTEKLFQTEIKHLLNEKENCEWKKIPVPKHVGLHLAYDSILLTQLVNGARISEAVEGIFKFKEDGERVQKVRARKRKKKVKVLGKDDKWIGEFKIVGRDIDRTIKIHKDVKVKYLKTLDGKTFEQVRNGVCLFMFNHHHANTHSLRYSFILKRSTDTPPQTITKMIRHTNLGQIMSYINEEEADKLLVDSIR